MKKSGFTLVELIFVIVIIGLLAAVAVPKFLTTKKNAETANFPEVGNQITTKANEQYNLVGEEELNTTIANDRDLNRYVNDINKTPFVIVSNSDTNFTIAYNEDHNYTCLSVVRKTDTVKVSPTSSVTAYNFVINELNTSCNKD